MDTNDTSNPDLITDRNRRNIRTFLRRATRKTTPVSAMVITSPIAVVLYILNVRFAQVDHMLEWMGHLASEPDLFVKSQLLGWAPNIRLVILAPPGRAVNSCILEYWTKYITVIGNRVAILLLRPLEFTPFLRYSTSLIYVEKNVRVTPTPAHYLIENRYEAEFDGQPLLSLSEKHQQNGWRKLGKLGIPLESWFGCLHVREGG